MIKIIKIFGIVTLLFLGALVFIVFVRKPADRNKVSDRDLSESNAPASPVANMVSVPQIPDTTSGLRGKPFSNPREITLLDYSGDAMEPGISADGTMLFFGNNGKDKDLFMAKKSGDFTYGSVQKLSEINSASVDSSPEAVGEFIFFTSLADYPGDRKTLFRGKLVDGKMQKVAQLRGNLYSSEPRETSLDPDLTANQEILVFAQGRFGAGAPEAMDVQLAYKIGDANYAVPKNSSEILKNINTAGNLEYAPAIGQDGLELFFTRATKSASGAVVKVEILQATRDKLDQPFGKPNIVVVADGFVEGPSLSADEKSLYYHKKVGSRFVVYVATRS